MQAIQLAVQATCGPGDEVIVPAPAWPNFEGALCVNGAKTVTVAMTLERDGWTLPLDQLFAAVTPRTRAIIINSPANPDRLDREPRRAEGDPGLCARARLVDHRRRNLRPLLFQWSAGAVVPRVPPARRSADPGQHLLEELGDDRLADRLAAGAAGARPGDRKPRAVQHVGRRHFHAARRDRRDRGWRTVHRRAGRPREGGTRHRRRRR